MPRIFRSASFRFTLLYAAIFCLSVLVLGMVMYLGIRVSLKEQLRTHILSDVGQLMIDYQEDGMDELRHDIREYIEANPANRLRYAIQSPEGRIIFDKVPVVPKQEGWHELRDDKEMPLLMYVEALKDGYWLAVAADLSNVHSLLRAMKGGFALACGGMLLVGMLSGWLISRRFLQRVDQLGRTAEAMGRSGLSQRIALSGAQDEFDHLAATINRMLDRIEKLVNDTRHVTTNIAHDLRTPLGRLRQKLDMLPQQPQVDEAITLLDETLETFSALLRIAEIESGARKSGFASVEISALCEQMVQTYQPVAQDSGHQLHAVIAPAVQVWGDRSLLAQLLANLIENAIRHTPDDTVIQVSLRVQGGQAVLEVRDNGTGVTEDMRSEIIKPFFRLDSSRTSKGVGLGMSLVVAIAQLHDAQLRLEDAQPGLCVRLLFPGQTGGSGIEKV